MEGEIYKKVIKSAYRVFKNFKEALKIGNWQKITMEEKITMKENYIKETYIIGAWRQSIASWHI